jgi:tetratricopeptide (TPR) repeat protein
MSRCPWSSLLKTLAGTCIAVACLAAGNSPLAEARRQYDAGEYQQCAATLRAALERNARDAELYHWLSRCYFELQNHDHAVSSAERAVQLDPKNSVYHDWLGRAYGRKAEHAILFSAFSLARKTRREFEEAVRLNPSNLAAQRDLIEFYFRAPGIVGGGDDKARRQIELLAGHDPIEGHLARAEFWLDKKKPDLAEEEYRQVLEAQPKRVEPYLEIADFYLKRSYAAGMERALEAAASVDASDRRLAFYRGVAKVLPGTDLAEAERLLKSYVATVPPRSDLPSHGSARQWLGRLYEREGKCAEAAEQYRQALKIEPRMKSLQEDLRHVCK